MLRFNLKYDNESQKLNIIGHNNTLLFQSDKVCCALSYLTCNINSTKTKKVLCCHHQKESILLANDTLYKKFETSFDEGQKILTVLKAHRAFLESEGFINFSGDSISDMDYVITNVNSVDAFVFEAVKYLYKKNGVNNLSQLGKELSTAKQIALKLIKVRNLANLENKIDEFPNIIDKKVSSVWNDFKTIRESRMIDFAFAAAQISNKSVVPQQAAQAPVEPNVSVQQTPQVSPPTQPQVVLENQNVEKPKDVVINQNLEVIAKQPSKDNNAQQKVVPQKNKSKKGLKITLILLSLLLILGGGAGAAVWYFLFFNNNSKIQLEKTSLTMGQYNDSEIEILNADELEEVVIVPAVSNIDPVVYGQVIDNKISFSSLDFDELQTVLFNVTAKGIEEPTVVTITLDPNWNSFRNSIWDLIYNYKNFEGFMLLDPKQAQNLIINIKE